MQRLIEGGVYLRVAFNRRNTVNEEDNVTSCGPKLQEDSQWPLSLCYSTTSKQVVHSASLAALVSNKLVSKFTFLLGRAPENFHIVSSALNILRAS